MKTEEADDLFERVKEIGNREERPRPFKLSKELNDSLFKVPKDTAVFDPAGEYHEGIERMTSR